MLKNIIEKINHIGRYVRSDKSGYVLGNIANISRCAQKKKKQYDHFFNISSRQTSKADISGDINYIGILKTMITTYIGVL